jgi:hypothetical protein
MHIGAFALTLPEALRAILIMMNNHAPTSNSNLEPRTTR